MTSPLPALLRPLFTPLIQQTYRIATRVSWRSIACQLISLILTYALLLQLVPRVAFGAPSNLLRSSVEKQIAENRNPEFSPQSLEAGAGAWSEAASAISGGADVLSATVTDAVVSRHKPNLNSGRIEGTLRVLLGESFTISGNTQITSELYLPGTPTIQLSGGAQYAGTVTETGSATPPNYTVSLSGSVNLDGRIHNHVDAIALPADFPSAVPAPTATRTVNVRSQSDVAGIGNWQTVRDLDVTGSHLSIDVPPGNYGTFTINGNSRLNFIAGAYNFANTFNLDGSASLQATGVVTINVAEDLTINSGAIVLGSYTAPGDVHLNVLGSSLNIDGSSQVSGIVRCYNGTVTLAGNAQVRGQVIANSFTLNGGKVIGAVWPAQSGGQMTMFGPRRFDRTTGTANQYLEQFALPTGVTSPFTLHIQNGEPNGSKRVSSATIKLNGSEILIASDLNQNVASIDRVVSLSVLNTLEVRLTSDPGSYLIINISGLMPITDTTPPTLSVTAPANNSTTSSAQINISGNPQPSRLIMALVLFSSGLPAKQTGTASSMA